MIPGDFDYTAPDSLDGVIAALVDGGDDAKVLAGGHSLIPLMKLRFAFPTLIVDLRRVPGLAGIERDGGGWRIGALTRHAELQARDDLGLIATAAGSIADQQVRNRGTIGGSLAHGDPASDLSSVLLAAEGSVTVQGQGGTREVAATELFKDYLTTSLAHDEVITDVRFPALDGFGFGYEKFTRRAEDWAMVGVCALVKKAGDGSCEDVRVGLTSMGATPLRARAVEDALRGGALDKHAIAAAAEQAGEGSAPRADLNATPEYKRHLARVLVGRALEAAAA